MNNTLKIMSHVRIGAGGKDAEKDRAKRILWDTRHKRPTVKLFVQGRDINGPMTEGEISSTVSEMTNLWSNKTAGMNRKMKRAYRQGMKSATYAGITKGLE